MLCDQMDYYAVRVAPQKERRCVEILDRRHVLSLYPKREFERRVHRKSKKMATVEKPALPGYVFIGFERDVPMMQRPWHAVLELHIVFKLLNINGVPIKFPHAELLRLFEPHEFYRQQSEARRRGLAVSNTIRVTDGPFAGFEGKIASMTDEELSTTVLIMGRACPLTLSLDQVVKVAA